MLTAMICILWLVTMIVLYLVNQVFKLKIQADQLGSCIVRLASLHSTEELSKVGLNVKKL
jgi:hypothetical protein